MANSPEHIANQFYNAFQHNKPEVMASLYHQDLEFSDPAFGKLDCTEASAMWQMLCESGKDLEIRFEVLETASNSVTTKWYATYRFGKQLRKVNNTIIADMAISDGKIISHHDSFDLHRWAKQALGLTGLLFGGTKWFSRSMMSRSRATLEKYMDKNTPG